MLSGPKVLPSFIDFIAVITSSTKILGPSSLSKSGSSGQVHFTCVKNHFSVPIYQFMYSSPFAFAYGISDFLVYVKTIILSFQVFNLRAFFFMFRLFGFSHFRLIVLFMMLYSPMLLSFLILLLCSINSKIPSVIQDFLAVFFNFSNSLAFFIVSLKLIIHIVECVSRTCKYVAV